MNGGLIILENGSAHVFGNLTTVRHIKAAIEEILPKLLKQERDYLLNSITSDELKQLIDAKAKYVAGDE